MAAAPKAAVPTGLVTVQSRDMSMASAESSTQKSGTAAAPPKLVTFHCTFTFTAIGAVEVLRMQRWRLKLCAAHEAVVSPPAFVLLSE